MNLSVVQVVVELIFAVGVVSAAFSDSATESELSLTMKFGDWQTWQCSAVIFKNLTFFLDLERAMNNAYLKGAGGPHRGLHSRAASAFKTRWKWTKSKKTEFSNVICFHFQTDSHPNLASLCSKMFSIPGSISWEEWFQVQWSSFPDFKKTSTNYCPIEDSEIFRNFLKVLWNIFGVNVSFLWHNPYSSTLSGHFSPSIENFPNFALRYLKFQPEILSWKVDAIEDVDGPLLSLKKSKWKRWMSAEKTAGGWASTVTIAQRGKCGGHVWVEKTITRQLSLGGW